MATEKEKSIFDEIIESLSDEITTFEKTSEDVKAYKLALAKKARVEKEAGKKAEIIEPKPAKAKSWL